VSLQLILVLCFFSSRRRHTRSKRDWSSDVCSSISHAGQGRQARIVPAIDQAFLDQLRQLALAHHREIEIAAREFDLARRAGLDEIGRASCRERWQILGERLELKCDVMARANGPWFV